MPAARKRLLVVCPHPEDVAPGQRLKYEQYFDCFREAGYDVVVSPFMTARFWDIVYKKGRVLEKIFWTTVGYFRRLLDLFRLPSFDVVYIFLWVTPLGPPVFERLFSVANPRILYDIDDLIFLGPQSSANWFIAFLKGRSKPIYLMKKAKHVIVCTPKLEHVVKQYNPNTTDISSTIDTDAYLPVNEYRNGETPTIGWSGSHSTVKYLHLLDDVLLELQSSHPFKLFVMGDPEFDIPGIENQESVAWSREQEVTNLQKIDIGVYPLPNEEWVHGKSGLKALQYMALGIPTIATAVGANFRVIEDEVSGYLVNSKQEWLSRLKLLIEQPEQRRKIGEHARQRVVQKFSVEANKSAYLAALEKVIDGI